MKQGYRSTVILLLFLATFLNVVAQEKIITGTVTDESGGLPGVSVLVKGTASGGETDFDGKYSIKAKEGGVLVFSFVGMKTIEKVVGKATTVNVVMEEDSNILEEIVVVGYGEQSERKIVQNISVIKEEAIEDIQATAPQDLLQGQSSGVQVVGSSGVLGAASVIRVRGVSSLTGGANPLIVIDGVPIDDQNQTVSNGGNTGLNPLSYVNTEDIATFTVLKDAAATSLYGTRGSNGVILITTKKGKLGQATRVTLDLSTSVNEATFLEEMMNINEYADFNVARSNLINGTSLTATDLGLDGEGFDWLKNVIRKGISSSENLGVSGGSEKSTYYFGLNHSNSEGFIIGNDLEKTGARINVNTQANDWLKAGMNLSVSASKNNRVSTENSTFSPITVGFLQTPNVLPFDEDGNFVNTGFIGNVLAIEALDKHEVNTTKIIGNAFLEALIVEGLKAKIDYGVDRTQIEETQRSVEINTPGGSADNRVVFINRNLLTATLNYNKSFGSHTLGLLLGTSYEETKTNVTRVQGTGFLSDDLLNVDSASTFPLTTSSRTQNRLYGQLFSRLNYDYLGKYLIEGSYRRDGSTKFGGNNKFGDFWAVAGGWVLSRESFLEDGFFDYLSVRASYGITGNDRIGGNFPALGLFEGENYNGLSGLSPSTAENPNLKWEETATLDVGFKSAFFNNRISFNMNYYEKRTDNLLINVPLPLTTGFFSVARNAGEIENRGFEFDLTTVNFRTEDFEWTTKINLSTVESEVLSLPGASVDSEGRQFIPGSAVQRAVVGESANSFYLIRYVGVNSQTGEAEWLDADGNITNSPTPDDRKIVGNAQPDFYGGITNTFKYKNFDLNIFSNFSYGNDVYIGGIRFTDAPIGFGLSTRLLDYWQQPGDEAYFPKLDGATAGLFRTRSTNQLKDGSFLRLKNVTLGYTLPKSILEKTSFIEGLRIYVTGTNLLTIKSSDLGDRDPEVTDSTNPLTLGESFFVAPQAKSYLVGAKITF
ncbi:SusC/RagA family TonB-dependent receptor precursor [Tenacibaculum maritimum]|uniref:SusC/RagA family TonB-linked outer membrane protein n=1 Tax=Tenacibaculum maritimum TaxID=107401 RepID=UPI0012E4802C|nr:TonB-dependent receptor [Tenacibaculum maritimum]CAA0142424.1 SusC/RagA family TonB-dependent receptor precursor [Tenacibaculum maritimum]CAA0161880.1 SusC/RagA family TonB-dependent receptor precursor [Tenacibaculum maritimum]